MIQRRVIAFVPETIHEKAVLHFYSELFMVIDPDPTEDNTIFTYYMDEHDWYRHCGEQTELWLAVRDPELAASDLKHRETPSSHADVGKGFFNA